MLRAPIGPGLEIPSFSFPAKPIRAYILIPGRGSGERKALRMVAQRAHASNFSGDPDSVAERASELLHTALEALIFNSPHVHEPVRSSSWGRPSGRYARTSQAGVAQLV